MKSTEKVSIALAAIVGIAALVVALAILHGFVLSVLWGWFVVPLFHVPGLSIPGAIGLAAVFGVVRGHQDTKVVGFGTAVLQALFVAAMQLGIGWIVKVFL